MRTAEALLRTIIRESQGASPDRTISHALEAMEQADQEPRNAWKRFLTQRGAWPPTPEQIEALRPEFIAHRGAATDDMFGDKPRLASAIRLIDQIRSADLWGSLTEKDWERLWLLVQHMDSHPQVQKEILAVIKRWLGTEHSHYRFLADRISCRERGVQRFGTQAGCKTADFSGPDSP